VSADEIMNVGLSMHYGAYPDAGAGADVVRSTGAGGSTVTGLGAGGGGSDMSTNGEGYDTHTGTLSGDDTPALTPPSVPQSMPQSVPMPMPMPMHISAPVEKGPVSVSEPVTPSMPQLSTITKYARSAFEILHETWRRDPANPFVYVIPDGNDVHIKIVDLGNMLTYYDRVNSS
jgi:hypothetical protein